MANEIFVSLVVLFCMRVQRKESQYGEFFAGKKWRKSYPAYQ